MAYRRGGAELRPRSGPSARLAARDSATIVPLRPGAPLVPPRPSASCPELDCLLDRLPAALLDRAERRAAALGVGAEQVLIAAGVISEEDYLRAFARHYDIVFESFAYVQREDCPVDDGRLLASAAGGILPLWTAGEVTFVVAPRGIAARKIAEFVADTPHLRFRFRVTSVAALHRFVMQHGHPAVADHAAESLRRASPVLSAAPGAWRFSLIPRALGIAIAGAALVIAPGAAITGAEVTVSLLFLSSMLLRLFGVFVAHPASRLVEISDKELPVYTVIAALYREAASVPGLVKALRQLDYPPEKLDVKLVIEADDRETRDAIARLALDSRFEIITAPPAGPRTKPKALNAALPFSYGTFTVVYDAEDRPEAGQLRAALDAFLATEVDCGCVQAALTIDNTADSLLTATFTAEYAAQFDVFLPSLAALRWPLPLGGSSNHFRTAALWQVGGWDPYNVTEDADLGVRLARFGHRAAVIASSTYEEAPAKFAPWLRQRTRWFKGWMQTWLVHMRTPRVLLRDLGVSGFVIFQLLFAGNIVAAMIYPWFLAIVGWRIAAGEPLFDGGLAGLHAVTLFGGLFTSGFTQVIGLARRGLIAKAWVALFAPVHWLLLSLAAWRGFWQLLRDPYRWEKTEHGLARTSRRSRTGR